MDSRSLNPEVYGELSQGKGSYICASDKMHRINEVIHHVADSDVSILIQGETGVGKEVVARLIHQNSPRKTKPFIKVHCAAFPEELLESEMFGYEKGAFTGAYRHKRGRFELADQGTIFLDEIPEVPLHLQRKFLHVLQHGTVSRLGGKEEIRVDVRVLAATNKDIGEAVTNGSFREDLYKRLSRVNITIPPLRERKEEIPVYVEYFLNKFRRKYNVHADSVSDRMMKALNERRWSGNVRELENVIQSLFVLGMEEAVATSSYN